MATVKQARVLFALPQYGAAVGDILEGDVKLIKPYLDSADVDTDKAAVAYAKSEGGRIIKIGAVVPDSAEASQADIDALAQQLAAAAADKPVLQAALDAKQADLDAL